MDKQLNTTRNKIQIILLIMDLDGTFLYGDSQQEIIDYCVVKGIKYGFVTRRSHRECRYPINIIRLFTPHFLVCAAGTELWLCTEQGDYRRDTRFELFMSDRWPGKDMVIKKLASIGGVTIQETRDEMRIACYLECPGTLDLVNSKLAAMAVRLETAGYPYLDIVPLRGGKAGSLRYLASLYTCPLAKIISCGGQEDDFGMLKQPHQRIVVANCDNRLYEQVKDEPGIYFSRLSGSAGVLEGLRYWGLEE